MAEPKEIGTVWTLGCDVFIEDALTADVQEIKVNDIVLSANIFTEGLSVEVGSDSVNAMDLDVRISMDGLKTYIIDSQIVPYEDVLKITDFSPEATNEKRYASSANTSKKIIDSVGELKGRVNVAEGDIDALEKRVDDLDGGSGGGFWYLGEDGKIHSDQGIVVRGDAIIEGDTSSGGEGEPVIAGIQGVRVNGTTHYDDDGDGVVDLGTIESGGGGGLTSVSWGDIQGTPPSVSTFDNDVPYVDEDTFNSFSEDVNTAISEVSGDIDELSSLLSSMWHLDENGNLVTDKQVLIKNNLIIDGDTSSGGEGEDTPSGGISGVKVNGTTYYDDNGDGVIDLGTISGGGGTADLSNYYTKGESDARYLASSLLGSNTLIHSGNIGSYAPIYNASGNVTIGASDLAETSAYAKLCIDGVLAMPKDDTRVLCGVLGFSEGNLYLGYSNVSTYDTIILGKTIRLSPSGGNVLIGTEVDSGYKLDVNGSISAMSALRIGGCGTSYCGLYPNSQITSGGNASRLWLYNEQALAIYATNIEIMASTSINGNLVVSGDIAAA